MLKKIIGRQEGITGKTLTVEKNSTPVVSPAAILSRYLPDKDFTTVTVPELQNIHITFSRKHLFRAGVSNVITIIGLSSMPAAPLWASFLLGVVTLVSAAFGILSVVRAYIEFRSQANDQAFLINKFLKK